MAQRREDAERQVSWAAGELSPALWARTDSDRYPVGARRLLNWVVTPEGQLDKRPGFQHVENPLLVNPPTDGIAGRFFAFIFDQTDNVALLFTDRRIKIYDRSATSPRTAFSFTPGLLGEVDTQYTYADLPTLRFKQLGNLVVITSPNHDPQELQRVAPGQWTLTPISYDVPAFPDMRLAHHNREPMLRLVEDEHNTNPESSIVHIRGDENHVGLKWDWLVTYVVRSPSGRVFETLPKIISRFYVDYGSEAAGPDPLGPEGDTDPDSFAQDNIFVDPDELNVIIPLRAVYPDTPRTIWTARKAGDTLTLATYDPLYQHVVLECRLYRGMGGDYGLVTVGDGPFLVDQGGLPDTSNPPPAGLNPFKVEADGALVRLERPRVSAFFEGRFYLLNTAERPNQGWGSAVDEHRNFDKVRTPDDADSLNFALGGNVNECIRAAISREEGLLLLTSASEWIVTGARDDEILTPNSIRPRRFSSYGCADMDPLEVLDAVFFMQTKGSVPRVMFYDEQGRRRVRNAARLARHLFRGYTIRDWCYCEDPYSAVFFVRSDGALLAFTFVMEDGIAGWSRVSPAAGGKVESCCSKPEGDDDALWVLVNRDGTRSVERLAYRTFVRVGTDDDEEEAPVDVRHCIYLDRSVSLADLNADPAKAVTLTDAYLEGGGVETELQVQFADGDNTKAGTAIQIDNADPTVRPVRINLHTLAGAGLYDATVRGDGGPVWAGLFDVAQTSYWRCRDNVTGLGHLEGQQVVAVVDGNVQRTVAGDGPTAGENLKVTAGVVQLGVPAAVAHVGLTYTADFVSLDAIVAPGHQKETKEVFIELEESRGAQVARYDPETKQPGEFFDLPVREVEQNYAVSPLRRREERVPIEGSWDRAAAIALRHDEPMPCTVLGLTRVVTLGGR